MCGAISTECLIKGCTNMARMDLICYSCKIGDEKDDYSRK
jgi:hypothetical protein